MNLFNSHLFIFEPRHEKICFAICEQQRRRSACASTQSDQRLCYSLLRQYNTSSFYSQNFNRLVNLCSWADRFESYLVKDPEDRFSHDEAHFMLCFYTQYLILHALPHFQFTCCGVQNYTDWESSYYNKRIINNRIPERNVSYPGSCYVGGSNSNLNNLTNTDYKDVHIFKKVTYKDLKITDCTICSGINYREDLTLVLMYYWIY